MFLLSNYLRVHLKFSRTFLQKTEAIVENDRYMEPIHAIDTPNAPRAIGPYSQAVAAKPFLFISGQLPIDPKIGKITAATIEEQTHQVINNIEAILAAEGLTLKHVIRAEVFLKNMEDFPVMNAVYIKRFTHPIKPARHTIEVSKLPLDAHIEIVCVAYYG